MHHRRYCVWLSLNETEHLNIHNRTHFCVFKENVQLSRVRSYNRCHDILYNFKYTNNFDAFLYAGGVLFAKYL